jgi:hypothetical protein
MENACVSESGKQTLLKSMLKKVERYGDCLHLMRRLFLIFWRK